MAQPAYIEPQGRSLAFTLHISGENYAYVIEQAKQREVARNRVINEMIAEHRAEADRRAGRSKNRPPK